MSKQIERGNKYGYVTSKFGRKLPIWEYQSDKRWIYQKGDRACVNYPIQGAATGDYMKIAMVRAVVAIKKAGLADKIKLVMNIHDALEFYVHKSVDPQEAIAVLKPAVVFEVPGWPAMKADWHLFRKWGSPTEIDVNDDGSLRSRARRSTSWPPAIEEDEDGDRRGRRGRCPRSTRSCCARGRERYHQPNRLTVLTPQGQADMQITTGLSPAHLAEVNQIFPGATVTYAAEHVEQITAGLAL
jgi:hypothetical protein